MSTPSVAAELATSAKDPGTLEGPPSPAIPAIPPESQGQGRTFDARSLTGVHGMMGAVSDRLGHVPALDGLRGIAILSVLLYHGYGLPGGFLGVDLFFVLSGFLITTLLLQEQGAFGAISLRGFYGRRARRLFPVAFAALAFCVILWIGYAGTVGGSIRYKLLGAVLAAFYLENVAHFLHPPAIGAVGHFWSLSQEEQFYLVWPPILVLLLRRRVSARRLMVGLAAVSIAVAVHRGLLSNGNWWRFYYAPDTRSDGIVLGCLLAVASKSGLIRAGRAWPILGVGAAVVYMADVATLYVNAPAVALYGITVANLAGATLIASIVFAPKGAVSRLLSCAPLKLLGVISYSLYIWQPLIASPIGLSGTPMLAVALVAGVLSYRYIERPFRRRVPAVPTGSPAVLPSALAVDQGTAEALPNELANAAATAPAI